MIFGQQNSAVEVLINQSTRRWREEVIDHCFNKTEAEVIKNIPLSSYPQRDTLVWPFTPNGQYTVNSGYRFLFEENSTSQPTQQSSLHTSGCWKKLWKMNIPNKIKNFVVWVADQQWQWLSAMQGKTAMEIFSHALEEDKDPSLLAYTAWTLWNCRNKARVNETQCPLNQVMQLARERRREFQTAQPIFPKQLHRKHTRWKPPDVGSFKVNYDGAFFEDQGRAGIGVVIRNSEGVVLASLSQQIPLPNTVAQVEALAARRAAEFALEIGINQVVIEGDSEVIYKDLVNPGPSLALHGHLIFDVL
ncbi:uncharacterized protein LOC115949977 [Quercus lobata]|uniref:uncharacterized protein LOC115949977 n=1 Tax=Quercus lobata TaxID=97700 RepID=UPI0012445CD0|nr:uncharacterized protein LOC115949977 [Quercus lobata]